MQYWSQTEATEASADWLKHDIDMIPEGQDLRQHYHVVMKIAGTAAEGGMTGSVPITGNICIKDGKSEGSASSI